MGFFKFANNTTSNATEGVTTERKPIVLQLNEESITIPASEAEGKTVSQLFEEYASDLGGDIDRVSRFVAAGQIVSQDTVVQLGTIYRGAITSESKG